jgi:hypothetical protein
MGLNNPNTETTPSGVPTVPNGYGLDMDLNKSILRSPVWSCGTKIPDRHGFHMDSKQSMWRSTHLALQQCFLADMVCTWTLTSPCGDSPVQTLLPTLPMIPVGLYVLCVSNLSPSFDFSTA